MIVFVKMLAIANILEGWEWWSSIVFLPDLRSLPPAHGRISPPCMGKRGVPSVIWGKRTSNQHPLCLQSYWVVSPLALWGNGWRRLQMEIIWCQGTWQSVINVNRLPSAQNAIMWQESGQRIAPILRPLWLQMVVKWAVINWRLLICSTPFVLG